MKKAMKVSIGTASIALLATLAGWLIVCPTPLAAQGTRGQNTVYSSTTNKVGSSAFIDASMFSASATDICGVLYFILKGTSYPSTGAVVDARGLSSSNTSMTCAANATPWTNGTNYANVPSIMSSTISSTSCFSSANHSPVQQRRAAPSKSTTLKGTWWSR